MNNPSLFFNKALRDAALNYNIMEKQAFALVKAIKDFRVYILHSHVIAYVPNAVVKDILTQDNPDGRRGKWIAVILEYDIEIKPTKLIKGQGLAKLMAESNFQALDINFLDVADEQGEMATPNVKEVFLNSPWYADLVFVLQNLQAPPGLTKTKARFLKLKALKFCILEGNLYWKDPAGILLNCLLKDEADKVLQEFHAGECGGHLNWKVTANKILRAGFYWPTLFADVHQKVTACHQCHCLGVKGNSFLFLLNQFQLRLRSSNGDSISLEKYTLRLRANIGGFLRPLIISPNGSRLYQAGKPLTLLLLNFLKITFCPVLVVLERSLLTMQPPFGRRNLLTSAAVTTLAWGIPQPTTLRGMGWRNHQTRPW
jgi:hypothetical protein